MKEQSRNPELLHRLPDSCVWDELSLLFAANVAVINAYARFDVTPALNHSASEDAIPYRELSDPNSYTTLKFANFPVICNPTAGPDGSTVYTINPRHLVESLVHAIESIDEAFGFDAYMVVNYRPLLDLASVKHFTFDAILVPPIIGGQVYYCPALRWDNQTTPVTKKHLKELIGKLNGESDKN